MSVSAEITLKEVYDILVDVRTDVTSIKRDLENNTTKVDDHEDRIRGLEKVIWKAMGVAAALGTGGGYLVSTFLP